MAGIFSRSVLQMTYGHERYQSVGDVEREALQRLPQAVRGYYESGADDEVTLARNRRQFNKLLIRPLALRDVSRTTTSVRLQLKRKGRCVFDELLDCPLGIAPTAFQRMAHPDGELATAAAARAKRTLMINSTLSTTSLEDVAAAADRRLLWFQLYVYKDRALTQELVKRAEAAGFRALVLTVDAPVFGRRRVNERLGFELPSHLEMANFHKQREESVMGEGRVGRSALTEYTRALFDQTLNWSDLRWLVEMSALPVLVKGIMRADDTNAAIDAGAAGIIVSNHGGRQLDHAPATIEALPEVVAAADGRVPVLLDGGVRCGGDIYRALALGASLVCIGRPVIWGLTVGGAEGVKHVLEMLHTELDSTLRLSGCTSVADIRRNDRMVVHKNTYAKL